MFGVCLAFCLWAFAGTACAEPIGQPRIVDPLSNAQQFWSCNDGTRVVWVDCTSWRVRMLDSLTATPRNITGTAVAAAAVDGDWLAVGGAQGWTVTNAMTGVVRTVTETCTMQASLRGDLFVVQGHTGTPESPVWFVDLRTGLRQELDPNGFAGPTDGRFVVWRTGWWHATNPAGIQALDAQSGVVTSIRPSAQTQVGMPSIDDARIAYIESSLDNVTHALVVHDLRSGETTRWPIGDPIGVEPAIDDAYVYWAQDLGQEREIRVRSLVTGHENRFCTTRNIDMDGIHARGGLLTWTTDRWNFRDVNNYFLQSVVVATRRLDSVEVTAALDSTVTAYGGCLTALGSVASEGSLAGRVVRVQYTRGAGWTTVRNPDGSYCEGLTDGCGRFAVRFRPVCYGRYRVMLVGGDRLASAASSTWNVKVLHRLGNPTAPLAMNHARYYPVRGTLKPGAPGKPVRIYKYRRSAGRWVSDGYVLAWGHASTCSYSVDLRLSRPGRWSLRAYAPSDDYRWSSWSPGYTYVTVN